MRDGRKTASDVRIYMDYHASTPLDPRVFEEMTPYFLSHYGNPHSAEHAFGWEADSAVERSRAEIGALIGADADELIFTSGATEANNLAILGTTRAIEGPRRRLVVSSIEHKSVLAAARVARDEGWEVLHAPVDRDGIVDLEKIAAHIDERTALVSVMIVNSEIGTIQPIRAIADLCQKAGALFHMDAAQGLGVLALDVSALGVDLLSLSAHKAYGPKGIGALYIRRGLPLRVRPIIHGGGQENGLRSGTLPTPLCVGFGKACMLLSVERDVEAARITALRDRLLENLRAIAPTLQVNGTLAPRHPGNLNVYLPGIDIDVLLAKLQPDVAASSGSACTSGTPEPSHVLRALGMSVERAKQSIRLSIGRFTDEVDIDVGAAKIGVALGETRHTLLRDPEPFGVA